MALTVFLIILVIIALILFFTNIRIVPQAHAYVIEHLGKYKTTWQAGLHVKTPFIERVAKIISLKEQVLDFPPQPVITKDNVTMQIDSVVFMKVFDPRLYTYGVENPIAGLQNLSATTLRNIIALFPFIAVILRPVRKIIFHFVRHVLATLRHQFPRPVLCVWHIVPKRINRHKCNLLGCALFRLLRECSRNGCKTPHKVHNLYFGQVIRNGVLLPILHQCRISNERKVKVCLALKQIGSLPLYRSICSPRTANIGAELQCNNIPCVQVNDTLCI